MENVYILYILYILYIFLTSPLICMTANIFNYHIKSKILLINHEPTKNDSKTVICQNTYWRTADGVKYKITK
jgi:uncharacterized membrane protein